jgi:replicative DNA helicase
LTISETIDKELTLSSYEGEDRVVSLKEILVQKYAGRERLKPVQSGLASLDKALDGGFYPGQLVVVSGISGHGKTTLCQTFTQSLMEKSILPLWFSYEMEEQEFADKIHLDYHGHIFMPLALKDKTSAWIEDRVIEANVKHDVKAVYIDHLHFLVGLIARQNMSMVIGQVVRDLKRIAVTRRMIMFLVCHTMKTRDQDGELGLGSIRDSSFIEQEADTVLYVWRHPEDKSLTVCKIAKNRRRGIIDIKIPLTLNRMENRYYEKSNRENG